MVVNSPVVSVIVPVFRSEDILARALGSLLAQTFGRWEAVLVDDGSPEWSWRVVQAYAWLDPRVRVVRQKHAGACTARNTGIAEARGEFLLFLDADDWLEPDAMERLLDGIAGRSAVTARLRYTKPDGAATTWDGGHAGAVPLFAALAQSNVVSVPSSAMIRRSLIDQIGLFDASLVHCGDWDLWSRVARHEGAIGRIDACVTGYRMRPGSLSRNPRSLLRDATTVIRRLHGPDPRVLRPHPDFAAGADRARLDERIAHFGVYAAGLAVAGGTLDHARAVLDLIPNWVDLSPPRCGEFLFYALCFAHCRGPEDAAEFWPDVVEPLGGLIDELQTRSGIPRLAEETWRAIDQCVEGRLDSLPLPLPVPESEPVPPKVVETPAYETLAHQTLRALAGL